MTSGDPRGVMYAAFTGCNVAPWTSSVLDRVAAALHDQRIGGVDHRGVLVLVVELVEEEPHGVDAGALLVVALDRGPPGVVGVGVLDHRLLGEGVVVPPVEGLDVHGRELPAAYGVDLADREAGALFGLGDREPQLGQGEAALGEHLLELGGLVQEDLVLALGAEAHHALDAGAVVPGPVEHHDLAGGRELGDVAVEVPLAALGLGGLGERDDAGGTGVEVLGEPLDGAALARGVAALEEDQVLGPGVLGPVLELQQLDLQLVLLLLVDVAVEPLVVGVVLAPRLDRVAAGVDEVRVGEVLVVPDAEAVTQQMVEVLPEVLPYHLPSIGPRDRMWGGRTVNGGWRARARPLDERVTTGRRFPSAAVRSAASVSAGVQGSAGRHGRCEGGAVADELGPGSRFRRSRATRRGRPRPVRDHRGPRAQAGAPRALPARRARRVGRAADRRGTDRPRHRRAAPPHRRLCAPGVRRRRRGRRGRAGQD